MNKSRKIQLTGMCLLLFLVLAAFGALKVYQSHAEQAEAQTEGEETYSVTQIDPSKVKEIGIINDTETVNLIKEGGEWKCADDKTLQMDGSVVESYLNQVAEITSALKIEGVEDFSQYGLDQPQLNITLQWENNMYTIKIGDYNTITGSYYISVNEEDSVYTVDSSLFYALNKGLEDFKQTENVIQ